MTTHAGNGDSETRIVHYRRKDGTEATGRLEPNDRGGWSWFAPEDCEGITGLEFIGGGGSATPGYGGGELPAWVASPERRVGTDPAYPGGDVPAGRGGGRPGHLDELFMQGDEVVEFRAQAALPGCAAPAR